MVAGEEPVLEGWTTCEKDKPKHGYQKCRGSICPCAIPWEERAANNTQNNYG